MNNFQFAELLTLGLLVIYGGYTGVQWWMERREARRK